MPTSLQRSKARDERWLAGLPDLYVIVCLLAVGVTLIWLLLDRSPVMKRCLAQSTMHDHYEASGRL